MPWDRPKPRTYEYNYQIQSSYYRPVLSNLDTGKKDHEAQTYAERIKTYPLYGGQYPDRPEEIYPPVRRGTLSAGDGETTGPREFYLPRSTRGVRETPEPSIAHRPWRTHENTEEALKASIIKLQEMEERQFAPTTPIWRKHPFYVPEDSISVPPREDSVWPETRPHFHLVSSYDCMVGYLGLKGMGEREMERSRRTH